MPRTLKRRSDAISRNDTTSDEDAALDGASRSNNTATRRGGQHQASASASASEVDSSTSSDEGTHDQAYHETEASSSEATISILSKKLVRLALSSEYSRIPLRRSDVTQKIFKESNASHRLFRPVFASAQTQLRGTFGMELFELPGREKTTLKDRRVQATQTQQGTTAKTASNKAWVLVSVLPEGYKTHPQISAPSQASVPVEAEYVALYTFIISLIYLNNAALSEQKLERYLKRVNADSYTLIGTLDKLLKRMEREGYIEKRRDASMGDEVVEYVVGPRGKVEVGVKGVAGLVRSVYGFGAQSPGVGGTRSHINGSDSRPRGDHDANGNASEDDDAEAQEGGSGTTVKIEREELEKRLVRSLGPGVRTATRPAQERDPDAMDADGSTTNTTTTRRAPAARTTAGARTHASGASGRAAKNPRRADADDEEEDATAGGDDDSDSNSNSNSDEEDDDDQDG